MLKGYHGIEGFTQEDTIPVNSVYSPNELPADSVTITLSPKTPGGQMESLFTFYYWKEKRDL